MGRSVRVMGAVGIVVLVAAGCSGGGGGSSVAGVSDGGRATSGHLNAVGGPAKGREAPVTGISLPAVGPKVIKTADLDLGVRSFSDAFRRAQHVAGAYHGYVVSTSVGGGPTPLASSDDRSGTLVLRVPSDRFDAALSALERLGHIDHENVSGQDVTSTYIDLKARLGNLATQRRVLLRLMDRATSIADTIRVEDKLTGVELQMEQIKGRLRYIDSQTTYGTITARIATIPPASTTQPGPSVFATAWHNLVTVTGAILSSIVIGAATVAPVVVLLVVLLLLFRSIKPLVERRFVRT